MAVVTMKQLLEAGVHFGHQTRRWNPKMKPFIFQERNGIYILDLQQTLKRILEAHEFVKKTARGGGKVLFVGTKKQAGQAVAEEAQRCGMFYINQRWLGGLLTNYSTLAKRIHRLTELDDLIERGGLEGLSKKDVKVLRTEHNKLQKYLGGVRGMEALPQTMVIIDLRKEHIAFAEAKKCGLPVVALVDTNCDPTGVDYPIPGNDDAIRAVRLICHVLSEAVVEGQQAASLSEEDFVASLAADKGEPVRAAARKSANGDGDEDEIDSRIARETKGVFEAED